MARFLIGLASTAIIFILLFGCTGTASNDKGQQTNANATPASPTPAPVKTPPTQAPSANTAPNPEDRPGVQNSNSKTVLREGYVNLNEIGGEGLRVMSIWKPNTTVSLDGSFTTEVSSVGAQLVMVIDKNGAVRASAISLPNDERLIFDAKSTTKASMWIGGSATQEEGTTSLAAIETFKCYPAMYIYMKSNLKQKSLSQIANISNTEYMGLQAQCSKEILDLMKAKMPN